MTASSLAHLPLAAGSVVLGSAARLGGWALARYLRAPLASTAILAMLTLSIAGAAHALYFEHGKHPAPLFGPAAEAHANPARVPPVRAKHAAAKKRRDTVSTIISAETTGSLPPSAAPIASRPIRHEDVEAVQRKLAELSLFKGDIDGYYGPKTAAAIRAFEQQAGLKPVGALEPGVVEAILRASPPPASPEQAPDFAPAAMPADPPVPASRPVALSQTEPRPAPEAPQALAAPPAESPAPALLVDAASSGASAGRTEDGDARESLNRRHLALGPRPPGEPAMPAPERSAAAAPPPPAAGARQAPQRLGPVDPATRLLNAAGETAEGAVDALAGLIADVAGQRSPAASAPPIWGAPRPAAPVNPNVASNDPELVAKVQRGLASLGFLAGRIDGVANESTARAIRNFQIYYNYPETGRVTPELVTLLEKAGAVI